MKIIKTILDFIMGKPKTVICPGCGHPIELEFEWEILYQNGLGEQVKLCGACVPLEEED